MKITDIKQQKRQTDRFNIYIDGRYSFALSGLEIVNNKIEIGKELEKEGIEKLKNKDEKTKAMNKALEIIARRIHSEKEVRDKLRKKSFPSDLVDGAVESLKNIGYIDDEAFAREWTESRLTQKPRGRILIKRELLSKGINLELVERILELVYNKDREKQELERLYREREKFLGKRAKNRNNLVKYLISRGFLWEDIREIIKTRNIN